MKIHSSLDLNIKAMSKDFTKHGITLVDDLGTRDFEQFKDIVYAVFDEIGALIDELSIEEEEYETNIGKVFAIRDSDRVNDLQASILVAKAH